MRECATGDRTRAHGNRLMCDEHGVAEDECGICHPELAATISFRASGLKVRFASADAAGKAGIEVATTKARADRFWH